MFFLISKIEQAIHHTEGLENPEKADTPMVFGIYRTRNRTAFFTVYSKKAFGEFWDDTARKKNSQSFLDSRNENVCETKNSSSIPTPVYF
ncbi:hypothetical protein [Empedobacter brevis]|uniref:hypothetical protein n=1 Tax=Empedobacter brevis TaxID=247 RepID=UPI0028A24E3E|nr:hypothetical protein [Empedobacter brevis]